MGAAFADHVLNAEIEGHRAERQMARGLFPDPESTDEHADRAGLEAARLIVVDEDARSPLPGDVRPSPAVPETAGRSRVVGLAVVLLLAAGLVTWLALASGR